MRKVIIKASEIKPVGQVISGTGAGCSYPTMTANKYSKAFELKKDVWAGVTIIDAQKGDKVVFAYV